MRLKNLSHPVALPLLLLLCGCEETKTHLPASPPPFASTGQAKSTYFKAEAKGEAIITAGTKRLQMDKFGSVAFSANGRAIGKFFLPVGVTDKRTGTREYLAVDLDAPKEAFSRSEQEAQGGESTFKKTIVHQGKDAGVSGRMEAMPDGKVQLSYAWDDFNSPDFQLKPYALMFDLPFGEAKSAVYAVDGVVCVLPDSTPSTGKTIQFFDMFKTLELFADNPARSIKISASPNCGALSVGYNPHACGFATFRVMPKPDGQQLTVVVDIGEGAARQEPAPTHAGIDFGAVEALELPDYQASRNFLSNPSFERGTECYWHWLDYTLSYYNGCRGGDEKTWRSLWNLIPLQLDDSTAKFGAHSLRLRCSPKQPDFRNIGYHVRSFPVPLGQGTYCFSVYAKGEAGNKQRLSVWMPGVQWFGIGNTFLPVNCVARDFSKGPGAMKVFELTADWRRYSFNVELPGSMPVVVSLGSDSADGQGHAWIDGLQLEKGSEPTAFQTRPVEGWLRTADPGNFLDVDSPVEARLELSGGPGATGTATVTAKDFYGEEVFRHRQAFVCDESGKATMALPVEGKLPQGIFVVKAAYELSDGSKTYDLHRLAIMKFLKGEHRLKDIFAEDYGYGEDRADFLKLVQRCRHVGIGAKCHVHTWDKAVWDAYRDNKVTLTDTYMFSLSTDSGRAGFAVCGDHFRVYPPVPSDAPYVLWGLFGDSRRQAGDGFAPENLEKLRVAAATIARDHPWVTTWVPHSEMTAKFPVQSRYFKADATGFWDKDGSEAHGVENMAKLFKAFREGVKEGNPAALICSDAPCNMSQKEGGIVELSNQLAAMNKIGAPKLDYVGIHPYRSSPETPDLDAETEAFLKALQKNSYGDTPVIWGEGMHYGPYNIPPWHVRSATWGQDTWYYGPLSYDMGWTEKISAAWRARSWLVGLKYQDHVKAAMSGGQLNNFEMDLELTPFAAQKMPNTLGNLLGDAYFKQDIRFAPYVRCYLFEDAEKRPVAAVWCHHPKLDAGTMAPPVAAAKLDDNVEAVFDLMGRERAYKPDTDGVFEFPVSSFPAFVRGKPGTLAAFTKAFEGAGLISGADIAPLALVAKPVSPDFAVVKARNFLSRPFAGSLILLGVDETPLGVPASGMGEAKIRLSTPLVYDKLSPENLLCALKSGKNAFGSDLGFDGLLCKKAAKDFPLDCDLSAWKDFPAIPLRNRILRRGTNKVDAKDFDGWFKVAWSDKGMNLLVKVIDDKFVHVPMDKDGCRWENDGMQVYFDSLCEARWRQTSAYDDSEYDYAVFPSPDGKSAASYRFRQPDPQLSGLATAAPPNNALAPELPSAFKLDADGYVYQLFVPAKYLLPARMEKGYALGFALLVNDRDDASADGKRKSGLTTTPPGTEPWNNPQQWPALLLWD